MSKIDFQNGGCGGNLGFSTDSVLAILSTRHLNAPHQVSIQMDYRGGPKYEFSTFFPYKCIGPIQMHEEANVTLLSKGQTSI